MIESHDFNIAELNVRICFAESPFNSMRLLTSFEPFRVNTLEGHLFFSLLVDDSLKPYPKDKRKRIRAFDTGNGDTIVDRLDNGGYQYIIKDINGASCCLLQTNKDFSDCRCALNGNYNMRCFGLVKSICSLLAFAPLLASCSLMHDDLEPCDNGAYLHFRYDYNTQRADLFNDHVGGVVVMVYDKDGKFLFRQDAFNTNSDAPIRRHDFAVHLNLQPGEYQFLAIAKQKRYEDALATPGAKFRIHNHVEGEDISAFNTMLDRNEAGDIDEVDCSAPLDTLWIGRSQHLTTVYDLKATHDTISLVRDTKQLTISLHQIDAPEKISADDFGYEVIADNGLINYDNSLASDSKLRYTPFHTWTTEFRDEAGNVKERTAHAGLMLSRLVYFPPEENNRNAMLHIYNKVSGKTIALINLPDILQQGRDA